MAKLCSVRNGKELLRVEFVVNDPDMERRISRVYMSKGPMLRKVQHRRPGETKWSPGHWSLMMHERVGDGPMRWSVGSGIQNVKRRLEDTGWAVVFYGVR